ncbi:MAG TPA: MFS transporter, partial [Armatimonadota bacterium]|nr:MFS transporter [Armatimonadota bacterium]
MTVTETRTRERLNPRVFVCEHNRWVWLFPFLLDIVNAISFAGYPLAAMHFGATPFQLGLLGCMTTITFVLACLTIGDVSDRWGRRRALFVGVWGYALSFAVAGCVHSVAGLLLAASLLGIGGGFLWPTLEAAVGDAFGHGPLGRGLLLFNIGWTTGMTLGAWGGGRLSDVGLHFPFYAGLAITLFTLLLMCFWEPVKPEDVSADTTAALTTVPETAEHFLLLARIGNCFGFFGVAILRALFAPVGAQLHFSGSLIGALIALITLGQAAAFVPLARSQRWQYR